MGRIVLFKTGLLVQVEAVQAAISASAGNMASQNTSATAQPRPFRTDVSRPARLPTANLQSMPSAFRRAGAGNTGGTQALSSENLLQSEESLDELSEKTNKMIDENVDTLIDAFRSILEASSLSDRHLSRITQDSLQMEVKADAMVRAAQQLSQLNRALATSLLLSKAASAEALRDRRARAVVSSTES